MLPAILLLGTLEDRETETRKEIPSCREKQWSNSQQHRQNSFLSSSCQFQSDTKQIASCVAGHGPWVQNPAAVGLSHFSESWCPLLLADREQESRGDIFISFLKDGLVLPFTYTCAYVCLSFVLVFVCACGCPQKPEGDVRCPRTEVACSCEPPSVGAGNPTLVLCRSSMYS